MTAVRAGAGGIGVVAAGAVAGAAMAIALAQWGPLAVLALLAVAVAAVLVSRPALTVSLLVCGVILLEDDPKGFLPASADFYRTFAGVRIIDVLLALALAGVVIERLTRRDGFRLPGSITYALMGLAAAIALGATIGAFGDADATNYLNSLRKLLYLLITPLLVANVIRTRADVRAALAVVLVLVACKTAVGLTGWVAGQGRPVSGTVLTYYAPTANFLHLTFVLGTLAALLSRVQVSKAVWLLAPLAGVVLLLSFRRSFWVAAVVGVLAVVLVCSGRRGRALVIPVAAMVLVAGYIGVTALSSSQSDSPVIQRAQTLAPSQVEARADDRYRLDEQRNVAQEILRHPVFGIGLGVPWAAREPLAVSFPNGRDYVHVVMLWHWLRNGVLGLISYLALMALGIRAGLRIWRRAPHSHEAVAGLGAAAALLGLVVAETTGSYTGVEPRMSVAVGALLGWLGTVERLSPELERGTPRR